MDVYELDDDGNLVLIASGDPLEVLLPVIEYRTGWVGLRIEHRWNIMILPVRNKIPRDWVHSRKSRSDMKSRREVLKAGLYVAPVILTLKTIPALASTGSPKVVKYEINEQELYDNWKTSPEGNLYGYDKYLQAFKDNPYHVEGTLAIVPENVPCIAAYEPYVSCGHNQHGQVYVIVKSITGYISQVVESLFAWRA